MSDNIKILKFKKNFSPYAEGDIAGVDEEFAKEAIKAEAAEEYKEGKEGKEAEEKKEPEAEKAEAKEIEAAPEDKMVKTAHKK